LGSGAGLHGAVSEESDRGHGAAGQARCSHGDDDWLGGVGKAGGAIVDGIEEADMAGGFRMRCWAGLFFLFSRLSGNWDKLIRFVPDS